MVVANVAWACSDYPRLHQLLSYSGALQKMVVGVRQGKIRNIPHYREVQM